MISVVGGRLETSLNQEELEARQGAASGVLCEDKVAPIRIFTFDR